MKFLKSTYIKSALKKMLLIILLCFLILPQFSKAQKVSAAVDRDKILIGEQVTLQLKAEGINATTAFLQNWFNVYDSAKHIQIVKREPVDTIEVSGVSTYIQKLTLTSFDSGKWKLPSLEVVLQDKSTGKKNLLQANSVFLEVLPVDVSDMQSYHDIKDIIEVEAKPDYMLYVAIAATVVILAIVAWLLIKQMKNKKPQLAPIFSKGTSLEIALQGIKELQQQQLLSKGQTKLFYTKLANILRIYFGSEMNIRSSQSTSDELMILLGVYLQNEPIRSNFYQLLRLADAVKFAKYIPGDEQNNVAVHTAITSLQHIDTLYQSVRQNA